MSSEREKTSFAEAMQIDLNSLKLFGRKIKPEDYEATFSKNSLHQDLGYIGATHPHVYDLDDDTRDRLIAHSRQDIVLTYVALINTRKELRGLRAFVVLLSIINTALLSILVFR